MFASLLAITMWRPERSNAKLKLNHVEQMSITAQQIFDVLRIAPDGLTSKEVSAKLGIASYDAGGRLSKLAAYGQIERMKSPLSSRKARWRLKQEHNDRHSLP
jgi:hypothetical protein